VFLLQPNRIVLTAADVTGTTASVVKRRNVSVQMSWRVASKLWDRLAHNHGSAAKVPVLNVDISAAALLVHLDASSLKSLLGLAASMLHFFQYREYRRLRPQVRSCTVPKCVASQLHSAGVCACALPTCCTSGHDAVQLFLLWGLG